MDDAARIEKFHRFKALHEAPGCFVIPNAWDAGSSRILTALGFDAIATTSAGFAFAVGRRDSAANLSRAEILANASAIADATPLPVSADLEDGFGEAPDACAQTIRLAADCGLVGGTLEDATGDRACPIYDIARATDRIAAASAAAKAARFVLTARAENFLWGRPDLDDTITRLRAFSKAGADVLYAPGLPNFEAIRAVCEAVDKPVNVVMGLRGTAYSVEALRSAGVKRISVGGSFARAALGAFVRAASEVKDRGTFDYAKDAIADADAAAFMADVKRS